METRTHPGFISVKPQETFSKISEDCPKDGDKNEQREVSVIRNGHMSRLMVHNLVVGDIVKLEAGDLVPVDGVFISANNVKMDESAMTGETDELKKNHEHPCVDSPAQLVGRGGARLARHSARPARAFADPPAWPCLGTLSRARLWHRAT